MSAGLLGLGLAGLACFTEDPPPAAPVCPTGSSGCPCYGNGSCDGDLTCNEGARLCVPPDCDPGREACVCDDGACFSPLECVAGICRTPTATGIADSGSDEDISTTTHGGSTIGTGSEPSTTTDAPTTTEISTTSPSTTTDGDDATTFPSSDSTTESPIQCYELLCTACIECVDDPGQDCEDERAACPPATPCGTAALCLLTCMLKGLCFDPCCASLSDQDAAAAHALDTCRRDNCAKTCPLPQQPVCE